MRFKFYLLVFFVLSSLMVAQASEIGHGSAIYRARNVHAGNLIRVTYHNHGMMGSQRGDQSVIYSGEWPIGTGKVQMGNTSSYVMSELRIFAGLDSTGDSTYTFVTPAIFCEGWNPEVFSHDSLGNFLGFEPVPGYFNLAQKEKDPFHAVAMSQQAFTWPPFWPDKRDDNNDPGWSGHWNGYFGKDQLNADEESYFVMDDYQYKKRLLGLRLPLPIAAEPDRGGLGLRNAVRGLQWSNPDAEDCLFWLYEIRNIGETNLTKTLYGINVGASSGALLGENTDWDDDVARFYREKSLAVNYDWDNKGTRQYSPVPWVGFAFLESPGNPYDGIDNDGDGINGPGVAITRDFFMKFYAVGDPIVLIDYNVENYPRTVTTMPANGVSFTVNGTKYIKKPNAPLEEIPRNSIDDNLNGLIDESDGAVTQDSVEYFLYIRDPIYNNQDYSAKDYVTGVGLSNLLIDERRDDGIDNDGDWDPTFDDVGIDGKPGTGDRGEGDGMPTPGTLDLPGEPNVDQVDVDESDQIGLTSFKFYQYGDVTYSNDVQMWEVSLPGYFDTGSRERADYDYVFSCGYFPLMPKQEEFLSIAMVYGEDERDILRNKDVVQQIYNSNYNFAIAPIKPKLQAVAGDKKVTLYWDSQSEASFDRFLREFDFEGYKVYRSTHHTFEDAGSITDGLGYERFKQPLAIYDKVDSVFGFFPLTFGKGVQFNLGNETGLVHTFVDSPLVNGMRYYYAVTAYDRGSLTKNIGPSETTIFVNVDPSGNISLGENVVAVIPNAPALGYVPPEFETSPKMVGSGFTAGQVGVRYLEPDSLVDGHEYEVQFLDQSMDQIDNDFDGRIDAEDLSEIMPIETTGFVLRNITNGNTVLDTIRFFDYRKELDSYKLITNLYDDRDANPRTLTVISNGMEFYVYNPPAGVVNLPNQGIVDGVQFSKSLDKPGYNLKFDIFSLGGFRPGTAYPRQYEIVFYNEVVRKSEYLGVPLAATGTPIPLPPRDVNYRIYDKQTGEEVHFAVVDESASKTVVKPGQFSAKDRIVFFEKLPNDSTIITFSLLNNSVQDTMFFKAYGRTIGAGDTISLYPDFPFTGSTKYRFKVKGQKIDAGYAKSHLDKIKVVPNPYVVTAIWEPQNPYTSGRGPRSIRFTHLPMQCTIRIYAIDGTLVQTLEHNSTMSDGSEEWDLMTMDNMDIAYGVYFYHIDAPGIGEHVGRILIIK